MISAATARRRRRPVVFEGLVPQMSRLYQETQSEFTRNRIRSFMRKELCQTCRGPAQA
jgi:excinuclease UvrABC ATPase subunit